MAVSATARRLGRSLFKRGRRALLGGAGMGGLKKRRRRGALTATEMGKITFMAQTLGKRNPAITLMIMKALGGKL